MEYLLIIKYGRTFTVLFQDKTGGLELRDPQTGEFMNAEPEDGTLVLNIGDMLGRFTNDYFKSAEHRVLLPGSYKNTTPDGGVPGRRTIPFFIGPVPSHTVATLPRFVNAENPARYEPVRFDQYGAIVGKYHYEAGNIG
jgi:isopenicillin N synthase-like dioxygenase